MGEVSRPRRDQKEIGTVVLWRNSRNADSGAASARVIGLGLRVLASSAPGQAASEPRLGCVTL
jgi:hypothetical protein